ncbi:Fc.00g085940.m01.CDS01 [Cosmosporella sp. VM-42]
MAGLETPTPPSASFPNTAHANAWYNLTAWSVSVNRYAPILEDLVWAGPRLVKKIGSYVNPSDTLEMPSQGYMLEPADAGLLFDADSTIRNIMEPITATGGVGTLGGESDPVTHASRLSTDGARGLGSIFGYATSKWALSCFLMAFILNRTHIFAATRRRPRLRWPSRLLLRTLPLLLLIAQARRLLQSIQCQTSPDFAELRWGDSSKNSDLMFSYSSEFLNSLSSTLLFAATDEQSCHAVHMIPPDESGSARKLSGSLSLLWPLFGTFCLSQFVETVACAVQGRLVAAETGMTLFEQSLAFAEADAVIGNQLGWGLFARSRPTDDSSSTFGSAIALSRSMILKRVNTPPEVLLVAFLSTMTHITSHVLGVFNLQAKYRLISTGFWGLCFMGSIVWSALTFDFEDPSSQALLRFPTVCIVGFVPHVLVLVGILMCLFIYGLALLLSAVSRPENHETASMSFRQRLAHAHENMQANVSLSDIRITREMDFYTALLRAGFAAITMASEAVYLNEDRGVSLKRHTWLEEERFREIEELQRKWIGGGLPDSRYDQVGAIGLIPVKGGPAIASNGYARERAAQKIPKGRGERVLRHGIGASERSSRWLMAMEFLLSINKLLARLAAKSVLWCLRILRIRYQPSWLVWLARHPKTTKDENKSSNRSRQNQAGTLFPYNENGRIPRTDGIDVEAEFRRVSKNQDEATLDKDLYSYWLKGGWWGSNDSSGDFEPHPDDDDWDTTSVVSMSTTSDDGDDRDGWESEEDDGQKTPTQRSPRTWREDTPFVDSPMQISDLARLLHPTSPEEREEARTLSAHLQNSGIMTRSRYRRMEQLQRTRILTTPGSGLLQPGAPSIPSGRNVKLSPEEEERLLEQLLLSRRQTHPSDADGPVPWDQGGSGFGSDGPQCVVCQSSPRTIIVWPCRCLSLCDDCRVSLAMNNFDKCVCCRREVISFSRIFVP